MRITIVMGMTHSLRRMREASFEERFHKIFLSIIAWRKAPHNPGGKNDFHWLFPKESALIFLAQQGRRESQIRQALLWELKRKSSTTGFISNTLCFRDPLVPLHTSLKTKMNYFPILDKKPEARERDCISPPKMTRWLLAQGGMLSISLSKACWEPNLSMIEKKV